MAYFKYLCNLLKINFENREYVKIYLLQEDVCQKETNT